MPVSHLGLTVSHIPSATSFYSAALQPLGYRFIGHQGDSIGFGVDSADFFITQAAYGTRPSPTHIAFLAENRNVVRDCYTASLNAGGYPNGAPNYRNQGCSCFNAAVEDLDGNTIEFIYRQSHGEGPCCCGTAAPTEASRVLIWQQDVAESDPQDDVQTVAESVRSRDSMASQVSRAKSRMQTALDLASTTSKSVKSVAPSQGIGRTSTMPANFPSKAIIGTALGAAAGAAIMFAMSREESKNAKDEADHLACMSRSRPKSRHSMDERPPARAETLPPSMPAYSQGPRSIARDERKHHRNYSTTESAYSRPYPRSTRAMRMIEATGYNDNGVQEALSRYSNLRAIPTRSRNPDESDEYAPEYVPRSNAGRSTHSIKRASTLPVDEEAPREQLYLEAPPKSTFSKHRGYSHYSTHSHRRSSHDDVDQLKRHDSGVSMHSSRSHHRERGSEAGRRSSASTIKAARRDSAQETIPLPLPPIGTNAPSKVGSRAASSCYYPAAISLPPSAASTKLTSVKDRDAAPRSSREKSPTYVFTRGPPPIPTPAAKPTIDVKDSVAQSWEDFEAEESDGLGDIKTLLPEDSISCVDLSKPRAMRRRSHSSRHSSHGGSRHSSRRSETSDRTVRPMKERERERRVGGLLPVRRKEGSRFSFV